MSKAIPQPGDSRILAAFQAVGSSWHAVAARLDGARAVFIEARTFAENDAAGMEAWLTGHHVGRVISVLPASAIICRTCTLPNGSPQQLDAALKLQAETQLLGSVPPHRMATAVLHAADGESSRSGLILGWPETSSAPKAPLSRPVTFAPVIASLAAMLNGLRPVEPIMFIDRNDGSMALTLTHANGAIFRAARIDNSSADASTKSILRGVTETALSVGHSGQFIDETNRQLRAKLEAAHREGAALILPEAMTASLASRLHGSPATASWWNTFGIAAGAALAASDQLASLTVMLQAPPASKPSRYRTVVSTLSDRRTAFKLIAACLAIIIFGPAVFGGLRLLVLTIRYPNLEERLAEINESKQALAMYADLKNQAWSMTKVLSDLVCSAPEGIDFDSVAVDFGKELRVKGTAKSHKNLSATELIGQMQSNMQRYGIFKEARPSWDNANAQGTSYEFNLVARVDDAHVRPNYPEELDFAALTLADRRYGKQPKPGENAPATSVASRPAVKTTPPAQATPKEGEAAPAPADGEVVAEAPAEGEEEVAMSERPQHRRPIGGDQTGLADGASSRSGGGGAPLADRIPQPLTEAQIASMSKAEAVAAQAEVSKALKTPGLSAELRDRLMREFRRLTERVREFEQ